jgi:ribosomal protein L24E
MGLQGTRLPVAEPEEIKPKDERTKPCQFCGRAFRRGPGASEASWQTRAFCSRSCASRAYALQQTPQAVEETPPANRAGGPVLCDCGRARATRWAHFHILAGNSQQRHEATLHLCEACYQELLREDKDAW